MNGLILSLAFTALSCASSIQPALHGDYPRTFMYSMMSVTGAPFRSGTNVDYNKVEMQSRWDNVILDMVGNRAHASGGDNRPVVRATRTYSPEINLIAYSQGSTIFKCTTGWWWDAGTGWSWDGLLGGCDTSATDFDWAKTRVIRAYNAMIYSSTRDRNNDGRKDAACPGSDVGDHCGANLQVDWAVPGFAQAMADTIAAWAQELTGTWSGVFIDETCNSTLFNFFGAGEDSVDFTRGGYASAAAWDIAYRAGLQSFWARLRSRLPSNFLVLGNCGAMGDTTLNGWMREVWPDQNGGTWELNMFGPAPGVALDVGYLGNDNTYVAPTMCMLTLQRADTNTPQSDLTAQRRHRWVVGSATLGDGVGTIVRTTQDPLRGYLPWWMDEFAVTPDGRSTLDKTYKGWLGDPTSEHYAVGNGWRRDFVGGSVLVNPSAGNVTFTLGDGYYHIDGLTARTINDGSPASTVTVQSHDAVFVQKRPR